MANMSVGVGGSSYYDLARQQRIFIATANVTAPVIYTTAAGTGGPLLWNSSVINKGQTRVNCVLLSVGIGMTTASGVACSLGITGNSGQAAAPTATTAIDGTANSNVGGTNTSNVNVYRVGTVTNAGNFLMPIGLLGTGAVTLDNLDMMWTDLGGSIIVPPGSWAAVSASATATSAVLNVGLMWAEIPF